MSIIFSSAFSKRKKWKWEEEKEKVEKRKEKVSPPAHLFSACLCPQAKSGSPNLSTAVAWDFSAPLVPLVHHVHSSQGPTVSLAFLLFSGPGVPSMEGVFLVFFLPLHGTKLDMPSSDSITKWIGLEQVLKAKSPDATGPTPAGWLPPPPYPVRMTSWASSLWPVHWAWRSGLTLQTRAGILCQWMTVVLESQPLGWPNFLHKVSSCVNLTSHSLN